MTMWRARIQPRRRPGAATCGRHVARVRARAAEQDGFALGTAIIVLMVLALLSGAAISISTQTSTSTTRDNNVKAEIAAAEAGIQTATYRLSQLKPGTSQCINTGEAVSSGCNSGSEALGNNATFKYWTTLPLAAGEKCAGKGVEAIASTTQRCITSEGKVNGVEPAVRLQTLVSNKAGEALFGAKGIIGLEEVKITGSVKIPAVAASNGKIIGEGSAAFERGFELCPEKPGTFTPATGAARTASGVTIGTKKEKEVAALEMTRKAGAPECPLTGAIPANHATSTSNEDGRIKETSLNTEPYKGVAGVDEFYTEGKSANKFTGSPKYEMLIGANGKLHLGGSKYYICNFKASSSSTLIIEKTAKVEIFVDSPEDKANCPVGTGKFEGEGSFKVENLTKNPADLLIIVYGKGPFTIANGTALEASIYAPEAEVTMNGGSTFKGGILGKKVKITNGTGVFEWNEEVGTLLNGAESAFSRKAWEQCTPGSGASEGC
jgi:Tfp pilus assembly protein PilX